ncbi:MAG: single-stranded-DNA-specific exonuclease [Candidatus Atribacteria bacterium]|nr:single-stranded-DNA-specific exonuclease [Candidatus Atribacteria bacterium]
MVEKRWQIRKVNRSYLKAISKNFSMPPVIARILMNRGFSTYHEIGEFLNPSLSSFAKVEQLPGLQEAVKLIARVVREGGRIVVFGDYDADGIAACAIVTRFLKQLDAEVEPYLPNRFSEGYGLSPQAVASVLERAPKLVITVDCGIRDRTGILSLKKQGVWVMVTDHHLPDFKEPPPPADVVVSSWDFESQQMILPFSGAGLALALVAEYAELVGVPLNPLEESIDLACIGTVADLVPLTDYNRIIAKYGLARINRKPNYGVQALLDVAGISGRKVGTQEISFIIAPRLNAAGRMEDPGWALSLLLSKNYQEALKRAQYLNDLNLRRYQEEEKILNEIWSKEDNQKFLEDEIVVLSGKDWNRGILGIIASRLSDQLGRPVIVLSENGSSASGSARSIEGFNLCQALEAASEMLLRFGGHEMAAGLAVAQSQLSSFRKFMNEHFGGVVKDINRKKGLIVDSILNFREIDDNLLEWIDRLQPFGEKNSNPLFVGLNVFLIKSWVWGRGQRHLGFLAKQGRDLQEGVVFGGREKATELTQSSLVDLAFEVNRDGYKRYPSLKVQDWRVKK